MKESSERVGLLVVRVSKDEQTEGKSLDAQERDGKNIAFRRNIRLAYPVLREEGISGTTTNRDALKTVLGYAQKNMITDVIFRHASRFCRNHREGIEFAYKLWDHGVRIVTSEGAFDLDNMLKIMNLTMLLINAEKDNEERVSASMSSKVEDLLLGRYSLGSPPLWTIKTPQRMLKIKPRYKSIIKDCHAELKKQSSTGIWSYANVARTISKKYGINVRPDQLKKVVTNPIYCGFIIFSGQRIEYPYVRAASEEIFIENQKVIQKKEEEYTRGNREPPPAIINQAIKYGPDFLREYYKRAIDLRCPICGGNAKMAGWRKIGDIYARRLDCESGCGKLLFPNAAQLSKIKNKAKLICPVCGNVTGIQSRDCRDRVNAAHHECTLCNCHFILYGPANKYLLQERIKKKRKKKERGDDKTMPYFT